MTSVVTPLLASCQTILGAVISKGGHVSVYEPERTADSRSEEVVTLYQNSVTDFGQDISVLVGRGLSFAISGTERTSYLEREIGELLREQYRIASEVLSTPMNPRIFTKEKNSSTLEFDHSANSSNVQASTLSPDERKLLAYLSLSGDDYEWSAEVSGTLTYNVVTPSRYFSELNVVLSISRAFRASGANLHWISQGAAESAAMQIQKVYSERVAKMIEARYGLAPGSIQINYIAQRTTV